MDENQFKNNPSYLLELVKALEDLRRSNKEDIRVSQIMAVEGENRTIAEINKSLFSLGSILAPLFIAILTIKELRQLLQFNDRVFLVWALVFLIISLFLGLLHMIDDILFYRFWHLDEDYKLEKWSSTSFFPSDPTKILQYLNEYENIKTDVDKISNNSLKGSLHIFLYFQGLFIFISLVFICIIASRILLSY